MLLLSITTAHASIEHTKRMGQIPRVEEIRKNRTCFHEIAEEGCGHPRNGVSEFKSCLYLNEERLSDTCRSFFKKLFGSET